MLTKNHQTNRIARYFMKTILLSVMIYIMIRLPITIFIMVTKTPFTHAAHIIHFSDSMIDFVGARFPLPLNENLTIHVSMVDTLFMFTTIRSDSDQK